MRFFAFISALLFCALSAAMPPWDITVYPTSTIAYGNVTIDGEPAQDGDIVYAFVFQECRGKQPVKIHEGKAYLTMNIQGMENHEPVYFKLWDASADSVYDVNFTTYTKPNGDLGYPPDVLPINAVKEGVTFFFPPENLHMHPFERRELNVAYYCNSTQQIHSIRTFGADNLEVVPDDLNLNIAATTNWTGEEEIEIELLNNNNEVIQFASILIKVTSN